MTTVSCVKIRFYFDYKSPFSYLGANLTKKLEKSLPTSVQISWLPNDFNMKDNFGSPTERTENQWRKVRYAYKDVRRFANLQQVKIYGPEKAYDSTLARMGGIFLLRKSNYQSTEEFLHYTDFVFQQFFLRKLDIEDLSAISDVLKSHAMQSDADIREFHEFVKSEGNQFIQEINNSAEKDGVFGSPTWVFDIDGDIFFGQDRFDFIQQKIFQLNHSNEVLHYRLALLKEKEKECHISMNTIIDHLQSKL